MRLLSGRSLASTAAITWSDRRELAVVVRELRERPPPNLLLALRHGLGSGLAGEHEPVGVAHHDRTTELPQPLRALGRLRPALDHVAEADEPVDGALLETASSASKPTALPSTSEKSPIRIQSGFGASRVCDWPKSRRPDARCAAWWSS